MINNRYHILRFLGEGRSKVFLCSDKFHSCSLFAAKFLPADAIEEEIISFRKEFQTLQKFRHPNIVKVYDYCKVMKADPEDISSGIQTGSEFFIMEYCEGKKISDYDFKNNHALLLEIIEQICSFLFFLHLSDHIYFDLKADNIIVFREDQNLSIKFIDFGLCEKISGAIEPKQRGTAIYMAPEIIENTRIDYRADLYSFGVLLYKLVYGKYPVESDDELSIYNQKLKGNFKYPQTVFPAIITEIIIKLLSVNPDNRFVNALQILNMLGFSTEKHIYNWFSTTSYTGRIKDIEEIEHFIKNSERREALIIKGDSGSGKTSMAYKIKNNYNNVVFLENLSFQDPKLFPRYLTNKIIFNETIYKSLDEESLAKVRSTLSSDLILEFETLKKTLVKLTKREKFILLIDDFDLLDEVIQEYLLQVFPILQINGCKIIIFKDTVSDLAETSIKSKTEKTIATLNAEEIHYFLKQNFAPFFPKSKLEVLILRHSDHLPGNIIQFIRDLTLFDVVKFYDDRIIVDDTDTGKIISWSQQAIYENRISKTNDEELKILEIISAIEINTDISILTDLSAHSSAELNSILLHLSRKNIAYIDEKRSSVQFTSKGLKSFVYNRIQNKEELHKKLADDFRRFRNFNPVEISRQYELCCEFDNCYKVLLPEIERAKKVSAFSYLKKLLSRLCSLPLSTENMEIAKAEYAEVLLKSGDPGSALKIIEDFKSTNQELIRSISIKKGKCLINTGRADEGKILLLQELEKIKDSYEKTELILEIANAELNTNDFANVEAICKEIIVDKYSTSEQHGRAYNFLGIVEIYKNDNPDGAISYFEKALTEFEAAGLQHRIARLKINIGNIYNMKSEHEKADEYWNSSLQINTSIGDIEQEALLLMNYGIFNYDKCNYEKANEFYSRASTIFATTGNLNGQALALVNSAETYLACCEYSKSIDVLKKAKTIFISTGNREEEASCLYLLMYNYYLIGAEEYFKATGSEYSGMIALYNLGEKHENQFLFMELLAGIMNSPTPKPELYSDYVICIKKFYNSENLTDFTFAVNELVMHYLKNGNFNESAELLNDESIKKVFTKNTVSSARYYYLCSLLSKNNNFSQESYQSYLFNSYELIKEQSITELTWRVLFTLGQSYYERGLYKNSLKFLKQSKLLVYFIAKNIDDEFLRICYLEHQERKNILEKIEKLEKLITGL